MTKNFIIYNFFKIKWWGYIIIKGWGSLFINLEVYGNVACT